MTLQQPLGADGDPVERIANDGQVIAAGFGEDQPLPFAMEQLEPKYILERFHLMADGALRDIQFLGRAGEAFASGRRFECFQAVQRWKATRHRSSIMRYSTR